MSAAARADQSQILMEKWRTSDGPWEFPSWRGTAVRSFNGLVALISLEVCNEITMLSISKASTLHHTITLGRHAPNRQVRARLSDG